MKLSGYQLLDGFYETIGEYAISSIKLEDAESIRIWRNQQISALRQSSILSKDEQDSYFKKVIEPSFSDEEPRQILLRYTLKNDLIGYGGLVHLNWPDRKGEVSFLLDTNRTKDKDQYTIECKTFLKLIKKCAFKKLGLNKISTYAYSHRENHVQSIENAGFTREGILRQDTIVDGNWVDAILSSCLRSEFEKPENFLK
jgi:RimJ/RimL family protein N-acetyltransferase